MWAGADARNFVRAIFVRAAIDPKNKLYMEIDQQLPKGRLSRGNIAHLIADPSVDPLFAALAIMAWGRMRRPHAVRFFEQRDNWIDLVRELRDTPTKRAEAYCRFATLRKERRLDGVGPAYFTKLIFFLTSANKANEKPGYIMDQWTARSANFLLGKAFIALDVAGQRGERRVSDRNTPETYERFCTLVEELAQRMSEKNEQREPAEIEIRMFAGGQRQNRWREELVRQVA
jgi:hypothetical protein